LDCGHRSALQRGQQHAPKRIAERQPEAALEWFSDDGRCPRLLTADIDLKLLRFDQFLPIFLEHGLSSSFPGQRKLSYPFDG
jgi:hypothetical protein